MSEKIYSWMLKLYPADFRQEYETSAMQLFCDRLWAERGFSRRLRFWLDVIADLAVSVPREHSRQAAVHPAGPDRYLSETGIPFLVLGLFFLLGGGLLLLLGMVLPGPYFLLLLWIACMFVPFWVGRVLKRKVGSARRSVVRARTSPWVWVVIVAIVVVNYLNPAYWESRWVQPVLGVWLAFAIGYSGVRRKRADLIWLGIYLLGLSVSLLWWPGGLYARLATFGIGAGGGFIVVGLARWRNLHFRRST